MTVTSLNRKLAVSPLKDTGLKVEKVNGIAVSMQGNSTVITTLLFDASVGTGSAMEIIPSGAKIAFHGRAEKAAWNKEILRYGTVEFVLAPVEEVVFIIDEQ